MIRSVTADRPKFQGVQFKDGLNVVLASRTDLSADRGSRNGLGKSTLLDIIHFCLGSKKNGTLGKPELDDWTFTMEFDVAKKPYTVSRNTAKASTVRVSGDFSGWPVGPDGNGAMRVSEWNDTLGLLLFGLEINHHKKYGPTFRSLVSYAARRDSQTGGYQDPFGHHSKQMGWDRIVNSAYLLGMDWESVVRLQLVRDRKKSLAQIKREIKAGLIAGFADDVGRLEAKKTILEDQINVERAELKKFRVHERYDALQAEANEITRTLHEMVNENTTDTKYLKLYEAAGKDEVDADPGKIHAIYRNTGLVFPDNVVRQVDKVLQFHRQVVRNRKEFVGSEIMRLEENIRDRKARIKKADDGRARILQILESHGALEEFVLLRDKHTENVAILEQIKNQLENTRKFEAGESEIRIETERICQEIRLDYADRRAPRDVIRTFNEYSMRLYESSGTLSIRPHDTGYKMDTTIERSGSHGIENMKIFCYDLSLARLWSRRSNRPGFLIHDSTIYDGVDERQVAHALQLAESESKSRQFQYICMLNSDAVPEKDFDPDFDFNAHVVMTLTDDSDEGGLLGMRF